METYTVAAVQATPILFDLPGTLEVVAAKTELAAQKQARVVLFPEAFVSAYPRGLSFGAPVGSRSEAGRDLWLRYWESSVEVPSSATDRLGAIAKAHGVYLVIGVVERDAVTQGTLYCSLLYFSPQGELLACHRKLKPTGAERVIWGEGDARGLHTVATPWGVMGGLICWENYMPLARMSMYQKGVSLYLAPTADHRDTWQATLRHIATEGRCYVVGCNQLVTQDDYPKDLPLREELAGHPHVMSRGGSVIISPMGEVLAGPLYDEEGILYATLDPAAVARARMDFDPAGHYHRPDVFDFAVPGQPETIR